MGRNANLWPVLRLEAMAFVNLGLASEDGTSRENYYTAAENLFREAAFLIDALRGYINPANRSIQSQLQVIFGIDKQQLYRNAFRINYFIRANFVSSLYWIERMKGQSILEQMFDSSSVNQPGSYSSVIAQLFSAKQTLTEIELLSAQEKITEE